MKNKLLLIIFIFLSSFNCYCQDTIEKEIDKEITNKNCEYCIKTTSVYIILNHICKYKNIELYDTNYLIVGSKSSWDYVSPIEFGGLLCLMTKDVNLKSIIIIEISNANKYNQINRRKLSTILKLILYSK